MHASVVSGSWAYFKAILTGSLLLQFCSVMVSSLSFTTLMSYDNGTNVKLPLACHSDSITTNTATLWFTDRSCFGSLLTGTNTVV